MTVRGQLSPHGPYGFHQAFDLRFFVQLARCLSAFGRVQNFLSCIVLGRMSRPPRNGSQYQIMAPILPTLPGLRGFAGMQCFQSQTVARLPKNPALISSHLCGEQYWKQIFTGFFAVLSTLNRLLADHARHARTQTLATKTRLKPKAIEKHIVVICKSLYCTCTEDCPGEVRPHRRPIMYSSLAFVPRTTN